MFLRFGNEQWVAAPGNSDFAFFVTVINEGWELPAPGASTEEINEKWEINVPGTTTQEHIAIWEFPTDGKPTEIHDEEWEFPAAGTGTSVHIERWGDVAPPIAGPAGVLVDMWLVADDLAT
mgnify:FL=1